VAATSVAVAVRAWAVFGHERADQAVVKPAAAVLVPVVDFSLAAGEV